MQVTGEIPDQFTVSSKALAPRRVFAPLRHIARKDIATGNKRIVTRASVGAEYSLPLHVREKVIYPHPRVSDCQLN